MTKFPSDGSGKGHQRLSPSQRAREQETAIALSASARLHAERAAILPDLESLGVPETCLTGDIVSLVAAGTSHDFAVIRRRWIVSEGEAKLEITLDHPPRPVPR